MKKLTIGLSFAALAAAGAAYAQPYGDRPNPDADGNGITTRAEASAHASQMFAKMDANSDGKLDRSDREAHRQEFKAKAFEAMDSDNDGTISRAEFMAFEHHGKEGKHHRMGKRGMRGAGMMMRMADTDKDGAISQSEFTTAAMARFDQADVNKDGQVTQQERTDARKAMRGKWRDRMKERSAS